MKHVITRRNLLGTSAIAVTALALVGCQDLSSVGNSVDTAATQIANDINQVAAGFAGVLPDIKNVTGSASSVAADIQAAVAKVQSLAGQVSTAVQSGVRTAAPIISQIASIVGEMSGTLSGAGVAMPTWVGDVLLAAKTLLPIALSLAGVALAAPVTGMTPAQARAILQASAARAA